jgi:hypothetical protein
MNDSYSSSPILDPYQLFLHSCKVDADALLIAKLNAKAFLCVIITCGK